jgi:hypothetical protein
MSKKAKPDRDFYTVARVYQAASVAIDDRDELEVFASLPIRKSTRDAWDAEAGRKLTPDEREMIRELFLAEYLRAIGRA